MGLLQPRRFGVGEGELPGFDQPKYEDSSFEKKYPVLAEFMQRRLWDKDKLRTPGSLVIFCEEGLFKVCLNDKDSCSVAFVSKKSFQEALEAAERGLKEDKLDWRLTAAGKQKKVK